MSAFFIYMFVYFVGGVDDRGSALTDFLDNGWNIGDLAAYDMSYESILKLLTQEYSDGIRPGPLIPLMLAVSKSIGGNYLIFIAMSIYTAFWVVYLTLEMINKAASQLSKKYNFEILPILDKSKLFVEILPFATNPVFMFYTLFPSTDIFFSLIVLMIVDSISKSKSHLLCFWFLAALLARPTSLFLAPVILLSCLFLGKKDFKNKYISIAIIVVLAACGGNYYFGYAQGGAEASILLSRTYSPETMGLSIWGFPFPTSILASDFSSSSTILLANKAASVVFTPFVQLVSLTGLRPSFSTIAQVVEGKAIVEQLFLIKPYLYSYIRFLWGMILVFPGLLIASAISNLEAGSSNLLLLAFVISFAIGLSPFIVLERYALFAIPYFSALAVCLIVLLINVPRRGNPVSG